MTNWIKQNGHEYYLKTPSFKAHRKSSIVIYLPCMTLMQTCLMCWSVGALPWGRKKEAVIPGTVDRALLRGKWTDGQGPGGWIYNRTTAHTAQERVSGLAGGP